MESKITDFEVQQAILQGATRKAPGMDGIPIEFYRWGWEIIKSEMLEVYNVMFGEEYVTKEQALGIIVCVPKTPTPEKITDYRQITLLNADYKIYARILANRLRTVTPGLLHESTTLCGVGNHDTRRHLRNT